MIDGKAILLVAGGGALGAVFRYGIVVAAAAICGTRFPYGTLVVNALGCFCVGQLAAEEQSNAQG